MKHRPRKRFGQNFLHDHGVVERIAAAIGPRPGDHFLEIGPGHGALTRPLLQAGAEVTAIEIVGNLPYNISTPLLFHALTWRDAIIDMHFMLQKEVVDRMAAPPGGKTYGRLSVMCQYACRVEPLFLVRPGAFIPPPAVDSRIVRLVPHAQPPVDAGDGAALDDVVRQAFSMRRKTLQNSLKRLLDADAIRMAGVDPPWRAR